MGNIIELCAAKLYPDPKISLGFTMCITRDWRNIPKRDLIEACALEHAIDMRALNDCAAKDDGAYGVGMLRDSVTRSIEVTTSSQVRLDVRANGFATPGRRQIQLHRPTQRGSILHPRRGRMERLPTRPGRQRPRD